MELGKYKLEKSLGKGGMGEVFLAYDSQCHRKVALKKIREDLLKYKTIQERFLREAHLAATLTHPSIISIFSIHEEENLAYYTMPYVEGETLKQLLRSAKGDRSIPALIRVFLSVCQAIAYCHSKRILHRDLKAENIIVGKFGEVLLLDWGIAEYMDATQEDSGEETPDTSHLTRVGKVVGTLSHLAPERVQGEPASEQSDLYALGVILYQLLTLKLPFKRLDLTSFQKSLQFEELIDPIEAAPYRDIPKKLSDIAKRCLQPSKEFRYKHVADLIEEIETYIEGRPEWIPTATLDLKRKEDWEFQENVLLTKHIAIAQENEIIEWVSLMISRASFSGNTRLEARIRLKEEGSGIGFLLNIPEADERKDLMDGYCVWIGTVNQPGCKVFRSNIEVMSHSQTALIPGQWHEIRIEKRDNHLRFFLDNVLQCQYISHTPLGGTHIGLLYRDADFDLRDFQVSIGSQNVQVSCMAVPDAFLANKDYGKALIEYHRIAKSFPGRAEEREAIFRAGVTLLEQGLSKKKKSERDVYFSLGLEEFGRLRSTAAGPLEYLGKSLVYKALGEIEEEVKCFELAIRKYGKHPLLPRLVEHIVFRMHESSRDDRLAAYHFALLSVRQLPHIFHNPDNQQLLESLQQNWEPLYFLPSRSTALHLAFLLAKPLVLMEMIESRKDPEDALFALLELGCVNLAKETVDISHFPEIVAALHPVPKEVVSKRSLTHIFLSALDEGRARKILPYLTEEFNFFRIWAHLLLGEYPEAGKILATSASGMHPKETSPLYPLVGCYILATEGNAAALAYFSGLLPTQFPRTTTLLGHYLKGNLNLKSGWITQAFPWEKMQLYRQLILYAHCSKKPEQAVLYTKLLKKEKLQRSQH